jgi:hypothetical protein
VRGLRRGTVPPGLRHPSRGVPVVTYPVCPARCCRVPSVITLFGQACQTVLGVVRCVPGTRASGTPGSHPLAAGVGGAALDCRHGCASTPCRAVVSSDIGRAFASAGDIALTGRGHPMAN